jgi:hypothetical protein
MCQKEKGQKDKQRSTKHRKLKIEQYELIVETKIIEAGYFFMVVRHLL